MLTQRQHAILNYIVGEYVASAAPVPSQSIASGFKVSPATIRNEMAGLEGGGFIHRPHISSGGVPSEKGYRFYVESLPQNLAEREAGVLLRRQMEESAQDVELWTKVAAEMLAEMARNMAVVSPPKAAQTRMKHIELVRLQEYMTLLVLVFQEAKTKQRILHFRDAKSQADLTTLSNKINATFGGSTTAEIAPKESQKDPLELHVLDSVKNLMASEDPSSFVEPLVMGLRHLLNQP